MSITTCHESVNVGTKLEFDYNGHIINRTACARQKGKEQKVEFRKSVTYVET